MAARSCAVAVALGLVLGGCGGGGDDDDAAEDSNRDTTTTTEAESNGGLRAGTGDGGGQTAAAGNTWAATARADLTEVAIYDSADAAEPSQTLSNPNEHGAPLAFLVDGADAGGARLPVFLPVPPNGTTGWVNASDVTLVENPYRITIELTGHRLTVTNGSETIVDTPAGVGRSGRETPTGIYYIKELLQPPNPGGAYGPYAYGISGFSTPEAAADFGGEGVIGIHGTNEPDSVGEDVSSGCIRVPNDTISEMAGYLPLGTPVEILA